MILTISKRFEFSASHRLSVGSWSDEKNRSVFGKESMGRFGHGHNYTAYFVFSGPVDERTGMMINVAIIKQRIKKLLSERFDHKYFNADTPPFDRENPTVENLAQQLLEEVQPLFSAEEARPVACHLEQSPLSSATAYSEGTVERHYNIDFSAARRTCSPFLSDEENTKLFGIAASPSYHGHHYRLRVTLHGAVDSLSGLVFPEQDGWQIMQELRAQFDHRNLSIDIPQFKEMPNTTEMFARLIYDDLEKKLPLNRVRLDENDHFFVEHMGKDETTMSISSSFYAAHRLHSARLSEQENRTVYGICNNIEGHGHRYRVESTISGKMDERSGTLYDLGALNRTLDNVLEEWDYKHLDLETGDFEDRPSTGENIIHSLYEKLEQQLKPQLHRLRLWETPNNRFTLREEIRSTKSEIRNKSKIQNSNV
jgi:6-pyruvoyltetrahydropterin/6-carboxytetrahydropterin synthase